MPISSTRRLRAFKRWMTANGIECSDALDLVDAGEGGISVNSGCELKQGDLVATIPKEACLTIKTSGARVMVEDAGLDGCLGLSVAIMYERSLGPVSPWAGYLQLLPHSECLPLVWSLDEVDSLLLGTELHKTVKEDKPLIYQDWKECILPLIGTLPLNIDPNFFSVEEYIAARTLVASRSFQIDDYHGIGMVPLADLFNHKTGAEDVHFTNAASTSESEDNDEQANDDGDGGSDGEILRETSQFTDNVSFANAIEQSSCNSPSSGFQQDIEDNPMALEMIIVKDVSAGAEVFNTYGLMGNAALLHRYGFTEAENQFDIVNIDLDLVIQWSSSTFSGRHTRARLSLWRKLGHSGCVSQNTEYFEISFDGEPQLELLILLHVILLPDDAYTELNLALAVTGDSDVHLKPISSKRGGSTPLSLHDIITDVSTDMLLARRSVREALLSLSDMRESSYGLSSLDDDLERLRITCCTRERKLYHSLMVRVSERRILKKLRSYAGIEAGPVASRRRRRLKNR